MIRVKGYGFRGFGLRPPNTKYHCGVNDSNSNSKHKQVEGNRLVPILIP